MLNQRLRTILLSLLGFLLLVTGLSLSGCGHFASKPLTVLHHVGDNTSHKNLFVFLRGLGGSNRSFHDQGLVAATWQHDVDFDMVAPNSHFAYYSERTLIKRLRHDVILPAKEKGYQKIWLVGVSMGGLGSLLYIREHAEDIDGVYLISPFLGYNSIIKEITAQGGLQHWQPGDYSPDKDWQKMFWHWLQKEVALQKTPPVYLGFGKSDSYVEAQKILATVLPKDKVTIIDGGHDYETFKALWLDFLKRDIQLAH